MLALLGSTYEDVQGVLTALGYKSEMSETRLTRTPIPEIPEAPKTDTPKAEDPKTHSMTEAGTATEPVSQATKPETETAEKTAAPETAAPDTAAPGPATPEVAAIPETIAAPAPRKTYAKKPLTLYNHRETDESGVTNEVENLEYWFFPTRGQKGFKPSKRGKPAFKGKGKKGPKPRRDAPKPPTQKQVENSPFAALAALKNPKKD